jgi:hypothetical protein
MIGFLFLYNLTWIGFVPPIWQIFRKSIIWGPPGNPDLADPSEKKRFGVPEFEQENNRKHEKWQLNHLFLAISYTLW